MKSLEDYINEAEQATVFAVYDKDGCMLNVYKTKEEAEAGKKEFETKGIEFEIKEIKLSEIEA